MRGTCFHTLTRAGIFIFLLLAARPLYAGAPSLGAYRFDAIAGSAELVSSLREISGIAIDDDGRLFAHNDEEGTIYQLDPASGRVIKRFYPVEQRWYGRDRLVGDFEDIAVVEGYFFLVTSAGDLYRFEEGGDGLEVPARKYETGLDERFDVEGLCFDPVEGELLLACKQWPSGLNLKDLLFGKKSQRKRKKPVYAFCLTTMSLLDNPRFVIDAQAIKKLSGRKGFKPSAIERHPQSGTFFVVSSSAEMIAEFSRSGVLLDWGSLSSSVHSQPEGIAFTRDGELFISDEGVMRGKLTRYHFNGR